MFKEADGRLRAVSSKTEDIKKDSNHILEKKTIMSEIKNATNIINSVLNISKTKQNKTKVKLKMWKQNLYKMRDKTDWENYENCIRR